MIGRRRFTRYVLVAPADGQARTVSDCAVESWDGRSAVVVTNHAARRGEELVMQFDSPSGEPALHAMHVLSCEMDPRYGTVRFRLHVTLAPEGLDDESVDRELPVDSQPGHESQ